MAPTSDPLLGLTMDTLATYLLTYLIVHLYLGLTDVSNSVNCNEQNCIKSGAENYMREVKRNNLLYMCYRLLTRLSQLNAFPIAHND